MSARNSHAADAFRAKLERASGMLGTSKASRAAVARNNSLEFVGKCLVAAQLGGFAGDMVKLIDDVEAQLSGDSKTAISRELVVPEAAFDTFGTLFIKADGAMSATKGTKDKNLLDTYRIPVVLDVAALKDAETFVREMRLATDALYGEAEAMIDQVS